MLDEANVMAGLDAGHSEERHSLTDTLERAGPRSPGDNDLHRAVGNPFLVAVDLIVGPCQYVKKTEICEEEKMRFRVLQNK